MIDFENVIYPVNEEIRKLVTIGNSILEDALRYGVYVFDLIYEENKHRTAASDTVLSLLFRNALELFDGINQLLKSHCVFAAKPLIRALLELFVQVEVITSDNLERNAKAYHLCHMQEVSRILTRRFQNGICEKKILDNQNNLIQELLQDSDYAMIQKKWFKFKKSKKYSPNWYQIIENPSHSINNLLGRVENQDLIKLIYSYLSQSSHGYDALSSLKISETTSLMRLLRTPHGFASSVNFSTILFAGILKHLIDLYLTTGDQLNFDLWLKELGEKSEQLQLNERTLMQ